MRIAHGVLILAGMLAACVDDPVTGPPVATELQVVSGGGQQGTPGYRLENEVVVRLLDERGNGVAGATIAFSSEDQYAVTEPATVVTDSTGVARAWWRLGATIGSQELAARYEALPSAKLQATATSLTVRNVTGGLGLFCVLDLEGALSCGGAPTLGAPNPPPRISAPGNLRFTEFVLGFVGCGVTEAGRIWCLNRTDNRDPFASFQELAGSYPPLHGLSTTATGFQGFCGLSAAGQGYCWGVNTDNRLAQPGGGNPTVPTPISTSQPFASIHLGRWSTCALTADGTPWCWGSNTESLSGQPSDGVSETRIDPTPMQTSLKFTKVTLDGDELTGCGFATTGGFWCWGRGYPQLRMGSGIVGHVPQRITVFDGFRDAKAAHSRLLSLHGNSSQATTRVGFEERGSVVFRAGDFGGNQLRAFLDGPFYDVVCGKVEVLGGTLCRSVWEQMRPFSYFLSLDEPAVGAFGIPPQ